MSDIVSQIIQASKKIEAQTRRGQPNFVWATEDTFKDIQECAECEKNKKRCAELEENLNRSIKNSTK
jgi:PHD/YefM family antitoxin component YafN of YafNO toxin-antitoxin module